MIIAVDFDGTLYEKDYPDIDRPNEKLINALIRQRKEGDKLILWTCREGKLLEEAVNWCEKRGLIFDAINDNLEEIKQKNNYNSRKIIADIYLDNKSRGVSVLEIQDYLYSKSKEIRGNKKEDDEVIYKKIIVISGKGKNLLK